MFIYPFWQRYGGLATDFDLATASRPGMLSKIPCCKNGNIFAPKAPFR